MKKLPKPSAWVESRKPGGIKIREPYDLDNYDLPRVKDSDAKQPAKTMDGLNTQQPLKTPQRSLKLPKQTPLPKAPESMPTKPSKPSIPPTKKKEKFLPDQDVTKEWKLQQRLKERRRKYLYLHEQA